MRRDFDHWYAPWYLTGTIRAPIITTIFMIVMLEFTEWYFEGKRRDRDLFVGGEESD